MTRPSPAYASIGEALAAYYYYLLLLILVYASRGEALEAVPVLVTYLLASSIFRHDVAPVFATAYFFCLRKVHVLVCPCIGTDLLQASCCLFASSIFRHVASVGRHAACAASGAF